MDLLTLAAAKKYTNKINNINISGHQLIEKVQLANNVQNISKIELIPGDKTESGKDEIHIYGEE